MYRRALRLFTPDDVAEAFAATRGVASPTQLRSALKADGRDLIGEFRRLAPDRRRISLQRWSLARVALSVGVVVVLVLATIQVGRHVHAGPRPRDRWLARLRHRQASMVLMAQAVPSAATQVPCLVRAAGRLGAGRCPRRAERGPVLAGLRQGRRPRSGGHAPPAGRLRRRGRTPAPSDEIGTERFERPEQLPPGCGTTRYYLFPGGCVTYEFAFANDADAELIFDVEEALGFEPRTQLVERVADVTGGLALCGAGSGVCGMTEVETTTGTTYVRRPADAIAGAAGLLDCGGLAAGMAGSWARTATSPAGSADIFDAVNGLPEALNPVLWPFQQIGAILGPGPGAGGAGPAQVPARAGPVPGHRAQAGPGAGGQGHRQPRAPGHLHRRVGRAAGRRQRRRRELRVRPRRAGGGDGVPDRPLPARPLDGAAWVLVGRWSWSAGCTSAPTTRST